MADDIRMDNEKRTYEGRDGAGNEGRPVSYPAYPESAYPGSHPNSPYSPYGSGDSPDTHIGGTQPIPIKKGLFDGISVAQAIAASAAAATSMLLASRIGIAGSVIGAAVSSMVTVICSPALSQCPRRERPQAQGQADKPRIRTGCTRGATASTEGPSATDEATVGAPRIRIAPTKLQARAAAERSASKRKVAVVSALIAIVAVAASAGIIMLTTSGQGLGTKAPSVFGIRPADVQPAPETDMAVDDPAETPTTQANSDTPSAEPAKPENGAAPPTEPRERAPRAPRAARRMEHPARAALPSKWIRRRSANPPWMRPTPPGGDRRHLRTPRFIKPR
ncbi:MAG: hypothetical protein ACLTSX_02270 [Collinsella sp.]